MTSLPDTPERPGGTRKRRLRAAFSADVANFSGRVSVSETRAFGHLTDVLKIGREELDRYEGHLIGMPGDGLFALFESAVDAVQCALAVQTRLAAHANLGGMRLRIGIHLGDVLFDGDLPFGETLNIAARLQALADPGGTLVSGAIVDAVSARVSATFEDRGVPQLKNIPRRIATFALHPQTGQATTDTGQTPTFEPLDRTMQLPRRGGLVERLSGPLSAPPADPGPPPAAAATSSMAPAPPAPLAPASRPPVEEASVSIEPLLSPPVPPLPLRPAEPGAGDTLAARLADAALTSTIVPVAPTVMQPAPATATPTPRGSPPSAPAASAPTPSLPAPSAPPFAPPPPAAPSPSPSPSPVSAPVLKSVAPRPRAAPAPPAPPVATANRAGQSVLERAPTPATIAVVAEALAVHLGPVARVMASRKAQAATSLGDLVTALEQHVPTAAEQHAFRARILRQLEP
ncbi:MAG: adenylate/guanylate cyclase domain-containing protein [Hyphomicrobiaceae bacterium]|nr:adenylate/guanylate cyclase domain-containing protein [Hyphomicrobiaceae bacterium]